MFEGWQTREPLSGESLLVSIRGHSMYNCSKRQVGNAQHVECVSTIQLHRLPILHVSGIVGWAQSDVSSAFFPLKSRFLPLSPTLDFGTRRVHRKTQLGESGSVLQANREARAAASSPCPLCEESLELHGFIYDRSKSGWLKIGERLAKDCACSSDVVGQGLFRPHDEKVVAT